MNKLKKSLSVLLTLVMLFTTLCFFPLDLGAIEADAAIAGIKIVVPETVYLNPSDTKAAQYYINNNADGSASATTDNVAKVYVTYPGATFNSVTVSGNGASVSWSKSLSGDMSSASGEATLAFSNALGLGSAELVEWKFTFTVNGETRVHYAYTVAYAPHRSVGAVAESRRTGTYNNEISSWITGINGIGGKDNWSPISTGSGDKTTQGIFKYDPLWNGLQSGSSESSDDYVTASTTEYYVEAKGTSGSDWTRAIGYLGYITVDSSRYTNTNQIPNFKIGSDALRVNDSKKDSLGRYYAWYILGTASNTIGTDEDSTPSGWTEFVNKSEPQTTSRNTLIPEFAVSSINGKYIHVASQGYCTYLSSKNYANAYVSALFTTVDKSGLRSAVLAGASYNEDHYTTDTWATYKTALKNAALALGTPGASSTDTSALTTAEAGLQTTVYLDVKGGSLSTTSFVVTIGGNSTASANVASYVPTRTGYTFKGWATSSTATSGSTSNVTVGFNQTLYAVWQANTYNVVFDNMFDFSKFNIGTGELDINERTDTGFTVTSTSTEGVDGDANTGFSAPMPVTPGNTYIVSADVTIERADIDTKGYDIYINTLNSSYAGDTTSVPDTANGAHKEGNVYISLTGQKTEAKPYIRFTAGETTAYITIRFDANTTGNKLTVNNIRVYEEGTVADGVSYEAPYVATYDSTYALPTPTRENYAFAGWFTADGTLYKTGDTVKITDTLHLYSDWTDANYFIAFDANSGEGSMETVKANIGENYVLPANTFKKTGYKFVGWALDKNDSSVTYGDKAGVQLANTVSTVTLYAVWTEDDFTITFDTDGGSAVAPITQKYNSAVSAPAAPTKEGYTFLGWDNLPATMPAENITVKAKWQVNQYTITFNSSGGSDVAPITQDFGTDVTAPTAPTKTGYTFDGWDALPATMPAENITVNAKWIANGYTIKYNTDGGTAVEDTSATYDAEAILAAAPTKVGYVFKGWNFGGTTYEAGATVKNLATDGTVTVKAVWEANKYTVTFDKNDSAATGTMGVQNFTYDEAQNLNALAFSKEGWHFVEWNTDADGKGTGYADKAEAVNLTADVDGEVTLYAIWTINLYDVTFKFNSVTGEALTVTRKYVPHGTDFSTLLPTADEGYVDTYYNGAEADPAKNTQHFVFSAWTNETEEITKNAEFVAEYTAVDHKYRDHDIAATCTATGLEDRRCACGFSYTKELPVLEHPWVVTNTEYNCLTGDVVDSQCPVCNATKRETAEPTGHDFGAVIGKAEPTCTTTGLDAYKICGKCNLYFAENAGIFVEGAADLSGFIIPEKGHNYGDLIPEVEATCEGAGVIAHFECSVCHVYFDAEKNEVTDLTIPAIEHDYEGTVTAPTCTAQGYTTYVCKNDSNHTYVDDFVDATGHDYSGEWVETTAPTCTDKGEETLYCVTCNVAIGTREVDADGHDYDAVVTDPTCETQGYTTYTCHCGDIYKANYVDALGHTDGETVIEKNVPATCLDSGSYDEVVYCAVCGKELSRNTVTVDALGHSEAVRQENITGATCTTAGSYDNVTYCTVCNAVLETTHVTGVTLPHTYEEKIMNDEHLKSEATCIANAVYYYDCTECDANAKDAVDGPTFEDTVNGLNKDNHVLDTTTLKGYFPATCYEDGYTGDMHYDCCDAVETKGTAISKDTVAHTPAEAVEENRVEATCYREGSYDMVVYCSVCEAADIKTKISSTTETIEKIAHTPAEAVRENVNDSTCYAEGSYDEVVYCSVDGCNAEISRTGKTIEKKAHTPAEAVRENVNDSTCYAEGSYDEVVYCSVNECKHEISRTDVVIEKKAHTPAAPVVENTVAATCYAEGSYEEVVYCSVNECKHEISRTDKVIAKIAHTPAEAVRENVTDSTCYAEGSYEEVVYCSVDGCKAEISRTGKTIEKKAHTPAAAVEENRVEPTCKDKGSYDEVVYCSVAECKHEISRTEKEIATVPHNPGETVIENKVPATSSKDGSYDEVTYCTFCGTETSREKKTYTAASVLPGLPEDGKVNVDLGENGESDKTLDEILGADGNDYVSSNPDITVDENGNITADKDGETVITVTTPDGEIIEVPVTVRTVKIITFVMKDKTEKVNAYNGDTVALPDVADYTAADGFIHKFKNWDKPVAVVNGDATYTAVYTEPADWSVLDDLEDTLNEILDGGLVEDSILEENKAQIETVLNQIENINKDRNTLDKSEQSRVDFVAGEIGGLLDVIYPDAGSTLVIEGASTAYAGTILDLKAVKMPLGAVLTDAQWTSSDEKVVFFSNGKLYAIGTGTVTLTAKRGILEAKKTITIVEGGNTRGINFTSINNTHFIIEDYAAVYNSAIIYWSDDFDLRFRVRVYQSFMFDDYIVYINGQEAEPNAEGYFVVPAGSGDVRVTIAGAMIDTGAGEGETVTKWSFWEWLLNFFRKIVAFFEDLFGIK